MDHAGALCGSCPPAQQASSLWPTQVTAGVPGWPGQTTTPTTAVPPCWSGQPNTPCWPGTQPASYPASLQPQASYPAPVQQPASFPTQQPASFPTQQPASFPTQQPASYPSQVPAPALGPAQTVAPGPAPAPSPGPAHPCQPCWPGPQYQPQPLQPPAPTPTPTPAPVPGPGPGPAPGAHGSLPVWVPPTPPSWPYNPGQPGWPGQNPTIMPPHWPLPPTSGPLSVPYNLNLSRGIYDKMMITIMGHVRPNAKMFTVNFLRGNDIAFHINPRFNDGGKQVLVRNHKCGERWGAEERSLKSSFPFAPGSAFEMKILCTQEEFRVAVNNIALFEFRHRVREINQIDRINILHDVVLTYVNVETLP